MYIRYSGYPSVCYPCYGLMQNLLYMFMYYIQPRSILYNPTPCTQALFRILFVYNNSKHWIRIYAVSVDNSLGTNLLSQVKTHVVWHHTTVINVPTEIQTRAPLPHYTYFNSREGNQMYLPYPVSVLKRIMQQSPVGLICCTVQFYRIIILRWNNALCKILSFF